MTKNGKNDMSRQEYFIEDLGEEEKNKLMEGIYVKDEAELYSILEDYSS